MRTLMLLLAAFALSACVVAIGTDEPIHADHSRSKGPNRHVTVNLDDLGAQNFECPAGFESFYTEDENGDISYGCRTDSY